jgi:hypothetical protein
MMPALTEHANVHNTMLVILSEKGYALWHDKKSDTYYAEKDGWDFAASSPCSLLGLVAAFEYQKPPAYREYWWRKDEPELFRRLPSSPPPYVSVIRKPRA